MTEHYIIVGRQAEAHGGVKYLHPNETDADGNQLINSEERDGAIPLTAEFIGKEVVDLSEGGEIPKDDKRYAAAVRRIKNALVVVPPKGHDVAPAELDAILENTEVELIWESRDTDSTPDQNKRTFVIPVKDTLARKRQYLEGEPKEPGFHPPLTYFLDEVMMRAYLATQISDMLEEVRDAEGNALPDHWQTALKDKIKTKLGSYETQAKLASDIAQQADANVLTDPVSAFHRAVGIYITNMCD